jgi:hypothetical protein
VLPFCFDLEFRRYRQHIFGGIFQSAQLAAVWQLVGGSKRRDQFALATTHWP